MSNPSNNEPCLDKIIALISEALSLADEHSHWTLAARLSDCVDAATTLREKPRGD